jgi:hypothetical protein
LSRRQAIPSNWFQRDADPLPPLFPEPVDGDHYYNRTTGRLRVFIDGGWADAVIAGTGSSGEALLITAGTGLTGGGPMTGNVTLALDTNYADTRYVNHNQMTVSPADASGAQGGAGSVWIKY